MALYGQRRGRLLEVNQWEAGVILAHSCTAQVEGVGEVHTTLTAHDAQALVNLGVHWKLNGLLYLLASAERQFGPRNDAQERAVFYFGLQMLR